MGSCQQHALAPFRAGLFRFWLGEKAKKKTDKASEVRHALELGADEIDLVICYKAPLDS